MPKRITTLCIIEKDGKLLLGMKKRKFGAGRWNGYGGKVEKGEIIEQSLMREMQEEAGIVPIDFEKIAIMDFEYKDKAELVEVNLFKAKDFTGELIETEEMKPQWFDQDNLPFGQMWPDDKYWMPYFLNNKKFRAKFTFADYDEIINHEITVTEIF